MKERDEVYKKLFFEQTSIPSDIFKEDTRSSDSETCSNLEEAASCSHSDPPSKKRGRINILDNSVAASFDAAKLSDRKVAIILTTTLQSVGYFYMLTNPLFSALKSKAEQAESKT